MSFLRRAAAERFFRIEQGDVLKLKKVTYSRYRYNIIYKKVTYSRYNKKIR